MILSRTRTRAFLSVLPLALFLTLMSSVALSGQGAVPRPQDVFGFEAGADYKLASDSQIVEYFHRLDAASDRVKVIEIGRSVLGRPLLLAFISSADNIRRLEHWRQLNERLALARNLTDEQAHQLARESKAIVWIDGGMHASEVAGAQQSPLVAYRVATEETPEMRQIRDNVILLLMPVMNPDGLDIVKNWYDKTLNTPYQDTSPPILWHFYAGHDNNRDWYMMNLPETRAVAKVLYQEWYPQIVYNQHQTAPFPARIFIPPFADPVNPNIPALVTRGVNEVGIAMGERLTEKNMPGAISRVNFDMWWNGGMRTAPYFHNMVGILTETGHATATPINYDPKSFPEFFRGSTVRTMDPSVFYPDPWKGGMFHLRDAVNYMVEADLATLKIAAKLKEDWLYNAFAMARDAVKAGEAGGPFAYVIPAGQRNEREAVELVNTLRRNGLEVQRATRSFQAGGKEYAAGSYVVPAAQPFRADVVDLMDIQVYPDMRQYPGGPPDPPYDMTGWTLPIQMDVAADRVDKPFQARGLQAVDMASVAVGTVKGSAGYGWALSHASNASAIAVNRLLKAGESVAWAGGSFQADGQQFAVGDIVVRAGSGTADRVQSLARDLGLDFVGLDRAPDVKLRTLKQPRIGIYKSWRGNMDEGWTRWVLDQYEFPYDTLHDAQIRHGDLSQYDAIILPDDRPQSILHGNAPGTMPEQYTGGMGLEGATALQNFVEQGGLVLALDGASDFAIDQFGLPVRDATANLSPEQFYVPGTLVGITTDPTEPIAYGMPENAAAFFVRSRAFSVQRPRNDSGADVPTVDIVARYARKDLLRSGWALGGERYLAGRPAVVRVHLGKGDVVLVGFRAQFRGQPRGTFKLLFNALQGASLDELPMAAARDAAGSHR